MVHDKDIHTNYKYADANGGSLIIQNSFPRGGTKYTSPDGEVYYYAVFFTRIINETDAPLELKINFPVGSLELPSLPGKYFKLLLPPDTMTLDKEPLVNYGLAGNNIGQKSIMKLAMIILAPTTSAAGVRI